MNKKTTDIILDKQKYEAAFLYLLNKLSRIEGKKKVYKLLYFLDFDFFEAYDQPFIGETYTALPMGPAPRYFDSLATEMEQNGKLKISKVRTSANHQNDTVVYEPLGTAPDFGFTDREKTMLDRIVKIYGPQTGKQLEDLSHHQAPYVAVGLGEVIPYEYSYYRDTPDLT